MAEPALDDVERNAFARELDGVGVAQLVRDEAPPDTRLDGEPRSCSRASTRRLSRRNHSP